MTRTLHQRMADAHEEDIAEDIDGILHKGSGNQWHKQMDASNGERLVPFPLAADGKATLGKSISITREMWAKAVKQTFGKIPTLWLRWYRDEGLRTVDLDLVAIERRDFNAMLEAARRWAVVEILFQETLTHSVNVEDVEKTVASARNWEGMPQQLKDLALKGESYSAYSIAPQDPEEHSGGCDCCR